jgi:hypothetical protein
MTQTTIIINEKAEITAIGAKHSKACKQVVCLDERRVFTSVFDAAKAYGTTPSCISQCCNGKNKTAKGHTFCFLKDIAMHLNEMFADYNIKAEKAAAYDALKAEENAAREAEEKYQHDLKVAEGRYSRCHEIYNKAEAKFISAKDRLKEAYNELLAVKERGAQFISSSN